MMKRRKSTITPPSTKHLTKNLSVFTSKEKISEQFHRKTIYKSKSLPSRLEQQDDCIQFSTGPRSKLPNKEKPFLKAFSRTKSVTFEPEILLITAVTDDDYDECRRILQTTKVDVNYRTASGQSVIHYAALAGSFACIKMLLEHGADVNVVDFAGRSVLDGAVRNGNFDCAVELINNGAMVEKVVHGGYNW